MATVKKKTWRNPHRPNRYEWEIINKHHPEDLEWGVGRDGKLHLVHANTSIGGLYWGGEDDQYLYSIRNGKVERLDA